MNDENGTVSGLVSWSGDKDPVTRRDLLNAIDTVSGYEPPIYIRSTASELAKAFERQEEEAIYKAVINYEVKVDKDELIRALKYDRDQYNQGYRKGNDRGYASGYEAGVRDAWNLIRQKAEEMVNGN